MKKISNRGVRRKRKRLCCNFTSRLRGPTPLRSLETPGPTISHVVTVCPIVPNILNTQRRPR